MSECSPGIIPYTPGEAIVSSLRNWASAALCNLALDPSGGPVQRPNKGCPGCTGVVTIDEQTHAVTYGLNYYQLGQVSKFVAPGAVRIGSNTLVSDFRTPSGTYGVTPGLDDVAFQQPGRNHRARRPTTTPTHGSGSRSHRAVGRFSSQCRRGR